LRRYGWAAWKGHLDRWRELVAEARASGFDYVELSLDYPLVFQEDKLGEAVEELKRIGLGVSFHAPWRGIDLASPWEGIRAASVELVKRSIDLASKYGAEYVVYHVTTSEKLTPDVREAVMEAGRRSVEEVTEYAKRLGVRAAVENVGTLGHPDYFGALRDQTDAEFCLDFAHAVSSFMHRHKLKLDDVNVDEVIELWKNAVGGRTLCAHVHGLEGPKRAHRPLTYPITKRAAAKAYALTGAEYVTFEIYYSKGNSEATPKFVSKEMNEVKSWEKVYKAPKAL